jgi:hypothetical protein
MMRLRELKYEQNQLAFNAARDKKEREEHLRKELEMLARQEQMRLELEAMEEARRFKLEQEERMRARQERFGIGEAKEAQANEVIMDQIAKLTAFREAKLKLAAEATREANEASDKLKELQSMLVANQGPIPHPPMPK